jgi:hypothetical protein
MSDEELDSRPVASLDVGLFRAAAARWEGALDTTLRSSVIPYGYTVTIWASGAYLINLNGTPSMIEAFGFVSGALIAFALLSALSHRMPRRDGAHSGRLRPDASHPVFAAGLHIAAVGLALLAAGIIDRALGELAWIFGSFVVTFIYLGIASAELAIALELQKREIGIYNDRSVLRRRREAYRRGELPDRRREPVD